MERIIKTSSHTGDLIYDPFAGSATSGIVSLKLSRRWIGSETLKKACILSANRFAEQGQNLKICRKSPSPPLRKVSDIPNEAFSMEVPFCR